MSELDFVVPCGVGDWALATGGNVFDVRVAEGLRSMGWDVRMREVHSDLEGVLSTLPHGALVLIDGLLAGRAPGAVEKSSGRLRLVVLAHMVSAAFPGADPAIVAAERRALRAAARVIVTSEWAGSEVIGRDGVSPDRVVVATPGSDDAPIATGTPGGTALLCVGVVAPHKGQDVLVDALAALAAEDDWSCTIAGSVDRCPEYAERIGALAAAAGLAGRVRLAGALGPDELDDAYRHADLVVAPSRVESYGMAVADALRRGIPVLASDVGGIPQAVAPSGAAVLVAPGEPRALREALERWMVDPALRGRMKAQARRSRSGIPHWRETADRIALTLSGVT